MHVGVPGSAATKPSRPGRAALFIRVAFLCLELAESLLFQGLCSSALAGLHRPAQLTQPAPPLDSRFQLNSLFPCSQLLLLLHYSC